MTAVTRTSAITAARAAFEAVMTAEATVMRRTDVSDDGGGFTTTYAAVGTYDCSYSRYPIRPVERENDPRVQTISMWTFRFPVGTDIRNTDRLVVGSRTFEVVDAASGSTEITKQAIAQEIT